MGSVINQTLQRDGRDESFFLKKKFKKKKKQSKKRMGSA
jgi:hypothetical protein